MTARIRAHAARYHPRADWTEAMLMAAVDGHERSIAELWRQLRAAEKSGSVEAMEAIKAKIDERTHEREDVVPVELKEYLRVGETYEQTNTRLLPIYKEAQNMKEMAIENADKTARVFWELKIRKLDLAMHWMHGRLIETV